MKTKIFGKLARALLGRMCSSTDCCPVCGHKEVASRIRRPWIIVDGPMYLEVKCGACGHTWRMLLRAGP